MRIQPHDVARFGRAGIADFSQHRHSQLSVKLGLAPGFRPAILLARVHDDRTVIGGKRWIMRVNGVERKIGSGWELHNFCYFLQLSAQLLMLGLRHTEIRTTKESQLLPLARLPGRVPAGRARRADQHTAEWSHRGICTEGRWLAQSLQL